jgi:hypothetical protein
MQRAALRPAPEYFKQMWQERIRVIYRKGIDKAKGATSTRYIRAEKNKYDMEFIKRQMSSDIPMELAGAIRTPGEALAKRRRDIFNRHFEAKQKAARQAAGLSTEGDGDGLSPIKTMNKMLGLRDGETAGDVLSKKGLGLTRTTNVEDNPSMKLHSGNWHKIK